jgi:hypothetical protein
MVCEYIEGCKTCGNRKKWFCTACIPKKRVMDRAFCMTPIKSDCAVYNNMKRKEK